MVKVISLSDKAYKDLKNIKGANESFSDAVLKLVHKKPKKSLLEFAGIWKDAPEMNKIFSALTAERHKSTDRKNDLRW